MEIKINKEIRDYTESIFFGLSLRQLVFSFLAIIVAVFLYYALKDFFGIGTLSWLCVLGAFPFAALGFIKYHQMYAEEALHTIIRSEFIQKKEMPFESYPVYMKTGGKI